MMPLVGATLLAAGVVTLVVTLHLALGRWVRERQRLELHLSTLERQAAAHDAVQTAIHHFRHDLNNLLFSMSAAHEVARATLDTDLPERATAALDRVRSQLKHSMDFVRRFRPGSGEEPAAPVEVQHLVLLMARPLAVPTAQIYVDAALSGWVVQVPPVTLAILVGNLIKNALEAAGRVRLCRRGSALAVENPVARADLAVLAGREIYTAGFSTKGEQRGVGLDSATRAAARCGLRLSHVLFREGKKPWVRFLVDFGDAAGAAPEPAGDPAGPVPPRTITQGDWPPRPS